MDGDSELTVGPGSDERAMAAAYAEVAPKAIRPASLLIGDRSQTEELDQEASRYIGRFAALRVNEACDAQPRRPWVSVACIESSGRRQLKLGFVRNGGRGKANGGESQASGAVTPRRPLLKGACTTERYAIPLALRGLSDAPRRAPLLALDRDGQDVALLPLRTIVGASG